MGIPLSYAQVSHGMFYIGVYARKYTCSIVRAIESLTLPNYTLMPLYRKKIVIFLRMHTLFIPVILTTSID